MIELCKVGNNIGKTHIELMDEGKMELTNNERTAHNKAWGTHCKSSKSLKKSRGKVYSLLLGQCAQVLVVKMNQDTYWVTTGTLSDPSLLSKHTKKFILKQSDNQNKMGVLMAEQQSTI